MVSYEIALTTVGVIELGVAVRPSYKTETDKINERPIRIDEPPIIDPEWKEKMYQSVRQREINQRRCDYPGLGAIIQIDGPLSL